MAKIMRIGAALILVTAAGSLWIQLAVPHRAHGQGRRQAAAPVFPPAAPALEVQEERAPERTALFHFSIANDTPVKNLLPVPPKGQTSPVLTDDLGMVPEMAFQEPLPRQQPKQSLEQIAYTLAKIEHVNKRKTDAFMTALLERRADLAGLPFAMGDACRMKEERGQQFAVALKRIRQCLQQQVQVQVGDADQAPRRAAETFWVQFQTQCVQEDLAASVDDDVLQARIAALVQVLGPQTVPLRLGLVQYLAGVPHVAATRALARLAIFSAEDDIRSSAVAVLKVRRDQDYTDILLQGLRYPWPAVAQRASDAIVQLKRSDLAGALTALLEQPDPRAPVRRQVGTKQVSMVNELVRINHHRNCMLCHAPARGGPGDNGALTAATIAVPPPVPTAQPVAGPGPGPGGPAGPPPGAPAPAFVVMSNPLAAQIPVPGEPLPSPSQGYGNSIPDILVRIDVTYLRQDFSLLQKVADAAPWSEMQRFDFLVRKRIVTDAEAEALTAELSRREAAGQVPYRRAIQTALCQLTGRSAEQ
jgi:hypothetical protein